MNKNLRWKVITICRRLHHLLRARGLSDPRAALSACPAPGWLMAKQLQLGLDLKGGVHLVLRVQTDDALRIIDDDDERAAPRGAAGPPNVTVGAITMASADSLSRSRASRRIATPIPPAADDQAGDQLRSQPGCRRRYDFTMKPNIERRPARADRRAGARHDRPPRQRARGGRAEHLALRPVGRPDSGAAARRDRRRAREGDHPATTAHPRAEAGRGAVRRRAGSAAAGRTAASRPTWRSCPARRAAQRRHRHRSTWCRRSRP